MNLKNLFKSPLFLRRVIKCFVKAQILFKIRGGALIYAYY